GPAGLATGESMAVIIQELVGRKRGRWFYPLVSGTAQSLNYYAISHAKPEDGLCTAALGLGTYVVEGGATQQFCPKWPGIQAVPPELAGSGSQTSFCALDAELDEPELVEGVHATLGELSLADAEGMGALDYVASTWDRDDLRLVPGASVEGPRIIDLGPILKYDALPLAPAITAALAASEELTNGPVELEYALDEAPDGSGPTLYLLQLKKLRRPGASSALDLDNGGTCVIRSGQAMGDGIIQGITDIIWLGHDSFDRSRSMEAAEEVATLDRQLREAGRTYILIGPGRWGSRDPWLGVPVDYSQITNASVIVETEMPGLSVDFSFGSHFMRNVTGRSIGYLAIPDGGTNLVDWGYIGSLPKVTALRYATHSRSAEPLEVLMDGVGR
ncbi:MAG: PEP/pyruvate-binding domain-containing protein, partial [Clostridia bacterium]